MKKAAPQPAPAPSLELGINRCPYCHDAVHVEGAWLACGRCLGRHHAACWSESGACGACGHDACLQRADRVRTTRGRNGVLGGLAFLLFVTGGLIAALTDGPPDAPPAEHAAPAAPRGAPVTLGAELSDARGGAGAILGKVFIGGPADDAALDTGDVVQSVDGEPVRDVDALLTVLATRRPGEVVQLGIHVPLARIHREPRVVAVCLVAAVPESPSSESDSREAVFGVLGLRVTTLAYGGVFVQEALAGAPAAPKVAEEDRIESVDGRPVANTRQLRRLLAGRRPGETLRLGLRHPYGEGSVVEITLPL